MEALANDCEDRDELASLDGLSLGLSPTEEANDNKMVADDGFKRLYA